MRDWNVPGYTEIRALGSGGFGEVVLRAYAAVDLVLDRQSGPPHTG